MSRSTCLFQGQRRSPLDLRRACKGVLATCPLSAVGHGETLQTHSGLCCCPECLSPYHTRQELRLSPCSPRRPTDVQTQALSCAGHLSWLCYSESLVGMGDFVGALSPELWGHRPTSKHSMLAERKALGAVRSEWGRCRSVPSVVFLLPLEWGPLLGMSPRTGISVLLLWASLQFLGG